MLENLSRVIRERERERERENGDIVCGVYLRLCSSVFRELAVATLCVCVCVFLLVMALSRGRFLEYGTALLPTDSCYA